jgi:hypothetical protein
MGAATPKVPRLVPVLVTGPVTFGKMMMTMVATALQAPKTMTDKLVEQAGWARTLLRAGSRLRQ